MVRLGLRAGLTFMLFLLTLSPVWTEDIDADVTVIASYLGRLMNTTLGVSRVQAAVNTLSFKRFQVDGNTLVANLTEKISAAIKSRVDAVRKLKSSLEATIDEMTSYKWPACCIYEESLLQQNENYKTNIDPRTLCEVIAPTAPEFFQSPSPSVLEVMKRNRELVPDIKWQYIGTEEGVLSLYPALKLDQCGRTDPRFRPWYIETARPYPKNVLILLDNSRSMLETLHSRRLVDISTSAIISILDTFTPKDRVGMVTFNNVAHRPGGCFQDELALATSNNIKLLKETFLQTLKPQGESSFTVGFKNAFELLYSSTQHNVNASRNGDLVILFITDGEPKEFYGRLDEVYRTVQEGNRKINNSAVVYTYGLGRDVNMTVLDKIASQRFGLNTGSSTNATNLPPQGLSFRITDPSMLRNKLTSFHRTYTERNDQNQTTFSVPYVDTGGLGLIFTVGIPVFKSSDKSLFGVAAVDITLQEVFTDAMYFDSGGDSYIFVIDGNGRVITHPLMPRPTNETDQPKFTEILELERHQGVADVIASMQAGESGNKTLSVQKVLPVGAAVQTSQVTVTYFWRPVDGANFSVCFVLETDKHEVGIMPQDVLPIVPPDSSFRYHRLSLDPDADICRHFYHKSTTSQSTVLFAPRSFRSPLLYESTTETEASVAKYYRLYDALFAARSAAEISTALQVHSTTADLFAADVIADVLWSSIVDKIWVNQTDNHVARRFIGTATGVDRLWPGTRLPMDFDVTKRVWYELAVANPNQAIFSAPYKDAAGAGNVISISRAILTPVSPQERKVIGVMGVDFSLNFLYSVVLQLYPNCKNNAESSTDGWNCILVDDRGNIILHMDYLDNNEQNRLKVKHISSDRTLMSMLDERKFVKRMKCLDLDQGVYRNWYKLEAHTKLNESYFQNSPRCSQYFMAPVPNTNIFFLARHIFKWCSDFDCPAYDSTYQCKNVTWNCPCSKPVELDACDDKMIIDENVPTCFPPRPELMSFRECIPEYLPQCNRPKCEESLNSTSCSGVVGCAWCQQTQSGKPLEEPYCEESEQCYNGVKDNRLPGYESSEVCQAASVGVSQYSIIAVCVAGSLLLIFLMGMAICWQKKVKKRRKLEKIKMQERDYDEVPISPKNDKLTGSPPLSPHTGKNGYARKHSNVPQVILSVLDTDGSEIIRKPVQLVKAGKTFGAPTDARRPSQDFEGRKHRNAKPAANGGPKSSSTSSSSGKDELHLSGEEDNGRPRTSSGLSVKSAEFAFARTRKRGHRTPDLLRTPVLRKIRHNEKAKRKRTQTEPATKQASWEGENPGYLASRSISSGQINKVVDIESLKAEESPVRWKSADDMLRYSTMRTSSKKETKRTNAEIDTVNAQANDHSGNSNNNPAANTSNASELKRSEQEKPFQIYV